MVKTVYHEEWLNREKNRKDLTYYEQQKIAFISRHMEKFSPQKSTRINHEDLECVQTLSGIFANRKAVEQYTRSLMPGSFGIWHRIRLETPYYSNGDEPIYHVNPVLKERNWKIPMVRGSAWKGAFFHAALQQLKANLRQENMESFFKVYLQIYRIFGTGSQEFRAVEQVVKRVTDSGWHHDEFVKVLLRYALLELGLNLRIKKGGTQSVAEQLMNHIFRSFDDDQRFVVHRGRVVFYPTYFDQVSLEVINPGNRKRRIAIFYETVPPETFGIFQLFYIPYDGILLEEDLLCKQANEDHEFLQMLFQKVCRHGIGAKSKIWGKFKLEDESDGL